MFFKCPGIKLKGVIVVNIEKSKLNHSIQSKIIPSLQWLWLEIFQGRAYTHFSGVAGQRGLNLDC